VESGGRYSIEALSELHFGRHWDPAARGMPGQLSQESQVECMPAGSRIWRQVVIVEVLDKLLNLEAEFLEKGDEPVL
jgi:hypothetical protein